MVRADAGDPEDVTAACAGTDVVYYLIHALGTGPSFEETDRRTARVMADAVRASGVRRLVYLGGLEPQDEELSPHLRSRAEVAAILLGSGVPTVVLRAAVVLGSGSASFEMLRYLTERLPVMVTPRWVHSRIQPIAIRDVLRYLVACARLPADVHRCFDIGGPDRMSYAEMMQRYARVAELPRRRILPVPWFSPSLSSHWVGLVTPVPAGIARPLVESLRNTVVCTEHDIAAYVPDPPEGLLGFDEAVRLAVQRVKDSAVTTRWATASVPGAPSDPLPTDPDWADGSLYVDERVRATSAPADRLWRIVEGIGGDRGWYSWPLAWKVRGWLDRAVGGVGLRRGRRDPDRLYVGDALDFWRVEERESGRLLRLRAEMRLPGLAWLEFHVEHGDGGGAVVLRQRATFAPRGLAGHAYWWAVAVFHGFVFGGMLRGITRAAEEADT
ncbi:SDR family oxidoreductase [Blastococcus sp. TF02-8]|uniref:SDR family oxidoreductase n=1 Tax=Blastococcus sp. TF02-8 TaxID=2250574 RepID=UPI001F0C7C78|nr:SDR family oxidoreductase [Blastococcus sp. TF02-8]